MTRRRGKGGDLDQLQRELIVQGRVRPVEDVQALPLADKQELDRVLPMPKPKPNHHGRERRAQLRKDQAGAPCACDDQTPCLAHYAIPGRRRHVRPA
jgi:hypothetical protein